MTTEGLTPFEIVGGDAPVCIDGVCELPGAADDSRTTSATAQVVTERAQTEQV
jgi:hypothetical protein